MATQHALPTERWFATPVRRVWLGAVIAFFAAWALVLAGGVSPHETVAGDAIQITFSLSGAALLLHNSRQREAVFGRRGTLLAGIALACWATADLLWATLSRTGWAHLDLINLGYALAAILLGLAATFAAAGGFRPLPAPTRYRTICDIVLLTASSIMLWRTLVWTGEAATNATISAVFLSVADAFFVVMAVTAWARAASDRRRALGLLAFASLLLYVTDLSYAGDLLVASYVSGGLLDFGWSSMTFLIGSIVVLAPPGATALVPGLSRWVGACLPPAAAIGVTVTAAIDHERGEFELIDVAFIVLGLTLIVRLVLFATEQFALNDQLAKVSEEQAYRADHDDLTGVLARRAFLERAQAVVSRHRRVPGGQLGFVWIDIDDFKRVNDTFGHAAGDHVLRAVANRLQLSSESEDMVGRLGGDEFVVLRPNLKGSAAMWAERLAKVVSTPIDVGGASIRVACSAGVVRSDGTDDLADLIVDGDLALLQAKRSGRAQVVEYTHQVTDALADAQQMAGHVNDTVMQRALVVRYQPVVDFETNQIVGAEALVRMHGPDGRELRPYEFLHLVELQGLLPQLFDIVLHRSLSDFAGVAWKQPRWSVAVNVTTSDITAPGFVERVASALRDTGTEPHHLVLELNERVAPQRRIVEAVRALEIIGVRFALDDFGTQWSHIDQVRELSPAFVKLDRELVTSSADDSGQGVLYGAVALAKSFGAKLVAEGIETETQAIAARSAGADLGQGWYWAPDLTIGEFRALVSLPSGRPDVPIR